MKLKFQKRLTWQVLCAINKGDFIEAQRLAKQASVMLSGDTNLLSPGTGLNKLVSFNKLPFILGKLVEAKKELEEFIEK